MKIILFLICYIGFSLVYADNKNIVLTMRDKIIAEDSLVRLSDVVDHIDGNNAYISKIKDLKIMNLGNTVYFKKVNIDVVDNLIRSRLNEVNVIFSGSRSTIVRVKTQNFDINKISKDIISDLSEVISAKSNNFSVNYIGSVKILKVPAGDVSYTYQLPSLAFKKRLSVWVDIYVDSKRYKSLPMWFNVKAIGDVAVALKSIDAGQKIDANDIKIEKRDLTLYGNTALETKEIKNIRVKKSLKPGEVVKKTELNEMPPVYKGQNVTVISTFGKVSIYIKGLSLDDGEIGESVRIKRKGSNRVFNAIVENDGLVAAIGS